MSQVALHTEAYEGVAAGMKDFLQDLPELGTASVESFGLQEDDEDAREYDPELKPADVEHFAYQQASKFQCKLFRQDEGQVVQDKQNENLQPDVMPRRVIYLLLHDNLPQAFKLTIVSNVIIHTIIVRGSNAKNRILLHPKHFSPGWLIYHHTYGWIR